MAIAQRTGLNFRPPSTTPAADPSFESPHVSFLQGTWNVTHSTLPMWKNNRNVTITYTSLPENAEHLDDLVEYQPLKNDKHKRVEGIDTPDAHTKAAYNWRGKGLLKVASSHWEILGYGEEEGGWVVTYFEKTLFTPAGIDIYARRRGGVSEELLEQIKNEIRAIKHHHIQKLADQLFAIKHNW